MQVQPVHMCSMQYNSIPGHAVHVYLKLVHSVWAMHACDVVLHTCACVTVYVSVHACFCVTECACSCVECGHVCACMHMCTTVCVV